ncbi:hypothetical protein N431DRAFT_404374 [Stipitochalara longipes BDJ]|nr:hypothetical protein N431DRAFT_404374 [Stipitochalara longipes BDJ]
MADSDSPQGSATPSKNNSKSPFSRLKNKLKSSRSTGAETNRLATPTSTTPRNSQGSAASQAPQTLNKLYSMNELWNVAYDELKSKEEKLIEDYEEKLHGDLTTMLGASAVFSGSKIERKDLMRVLLTRKIEEVKENTWKLKFGGHEIPVKDLAEPVAGIIEWADDYISGALSANPYASIAWAGVSLLLPLTLNPSKQAASFAEGLDYISDLIVRSAMRESLYERRYRSKAGEGDVSLDSDLSSHKKYQDTLKNLYIEILKFQASGVCYLSTNTAFRLGRDVVKWDKWDAFLGDIKKREDAFCKVYEIWKDTIDQENCEGVYRRHREKMETLGSISCNIVALKKSIEDKQRETSRTKLLDWLSSIDPSENYNTALLARQAGTGDWLLQGNSDFESWKTGRNSLLWLNGKAGSGKSVLSASIIEHLRSAYDSNPETALAYFYFSFNDSKKQDVVEMLSSIIKQLCCRRPDTPGCVELFHQIRTLGQRPDQKTLEKTLLAAVHGFTHVHLVLDALDECPSDIRKRRDLLDSIRRIFEAGSKNLHLLLTSRREDDITAVLNPLISNTSPGNCSVDIDLSTFPDAVEADISFHIDQEFNTEPFNSWPKDVKDEAKSALIKNAGGMFQYVSCQFDALRLHRSRAKIQEALRSLPEGLDATYNRMLIAIAPEYRKQVASVLKWLAFSLRPLLVDELAEIFILDPDSPVPFDEAQRLFNPEDVLTHLAGLVVQVPVHDNFEYILMGKHDVFEIRFAHFSIKEYLCSTRMTLEYFSTAEQTSHLYIAESCITYHLQLSTNTLASEDTLKRFILWDYVGQYWSSHLEKVARVMWTDRVISHATHVLSAHSQSLLNIVRFSDPDHPSNISNWEATAESVPSPLYWTASLGFYHLTLLLIHHGAEINGISRVSKWGTALQTAAAHKHEDVDILQLLIGSGAEINAQAGYHGNALQLAASYGRKEILQLLIDSGAEINAQGGAYGNALQAAAAYGQKENLQLLIDRGAEINAQGGLYGNALQAAITNDKSEIVELLLSLGAEIYQPGPDWEELILKITDKVGYCEAETLRDFQKFYLNLPNTYEG